MQAHAAYAPGASLGSYLECADELGKFRGRSSVPACGLRSSTESSTTRSERSSSGVVSSTSVSLQTTCMETSEVRSAMCSELHSWGKCGQSQHFSMSCGTGSSHFSLQFSFTVPTTSKKINGALLMLLLIEWCMSSKLCQRAPPPLISRALVDSSLLCHLPGRDHPHQRP